MLEGFTIALLLFAALLAKGRYDAQKKVNETEAK